MDCQIVKEEQSFRKRYFSRVQDESIFLIVFTVCSKKLNIKMNCNSEFKKTLQNIVEDILVQFT